MNKKAQFGNMLFFFILAAVLICAGLLIAVIVGIIDIGTEEIIPELTSIGNVGDSNVSEYAEYTTNSIDSLISSFFWMGGIVYMIAIFGLVALAFTYKMTMNRIYLFIFLVFAMLMMFLSILISNIYEDIYIGADDFATSLQEQTLLSWLILKSPLVFSIMIFISGIILFTGVREESYV